VASLRDLLARFERPLPPWVDTYGPAACSHDTRRRKLVPTRSPLWTVSCTCRRGHGSRMADPAVVVPSSLPVAGQGCSPSRRGKPIPTRSPLLLTQGVTTVTSKDGRVPRGSHSSPWERFRKCPSYLHDRGRVQHLLGPVLQDIRSRSVPRSIPFDSRGPKAAWVAESVTCHRERQQGLSLGSLSPLTGRSLDESPLWAVRSATTFSKPPWAYLESVSSCQRFCRSGGTR